jgi:hypothetical protein
MPTFSYLIVLVLIVILKYFLKKKKVDIGPSAQMVEPTTKVSPLYQKIKKVLNYEYMLIAALAIFLIVGKLFPLIVDFLSQKLSIFGALIGVLIGISLTGLVIFIPAMIIIFFINIGKISKIKREIKSQSVVDEKSLKLATFTIELTSVMLLVLAVLVVIIFIIKPF